MTDETLRMLLVLVSKQSDSLARQLQEIKLHAAKGKPAMAALLEDLNVQALVLSQRLAALVSCLETPVPEEDDDSEPRCPNCPPGTETIRLAHCGSRVCLLCGYHVGLVRCFCGWAADGGDGRAQLVELGETIEPD